MAEMITRKPTTAAVRIKCAFTRFDIYILSSSEMATRHRRVYRFEQILVPAVLRIVKGLSLLLPEIGGDFIR